MAGRDIHRIVVLDPTSQLTGIVTPMDVIRALARGQHFDVGVDGADDDGQPAAAGDDDALIPINEVDERDG
jgi:hypothetical protein